MVPPLLIRRLGDVELPGHGSNDCLERNLGRENPERRGMLVGAGGLASSRTSSHLESESTRPST
jgi:hypothetical protein